MTNRVALVTGGGKGIGRATSHAFGRMGIPVAVAGRTLADLEHVVEEIREDGGTGLAIVCDVTDPASVARMTDQVQREFGTITILVNSAGISGSHRFLDHDDELWHRIIDANLNSTYYVSKAIVPGMIRSHWGRIINIASIAAKIGGKYLAAYTASKHAVLGLTRALSLELVAFDITVNAICPGYVDTPMTDRSIANIVARTRLTEAEARAALEKTSPQNRLFSPEEVAAVALMLVGDDARGINGQSINVDGGAVQY